MNGKALEYNKGNQLRFYGSEEIGYDDNGNRTSDGKYTYNWDAADQLISVTKKGETTLLDNIIMANFMYGTKNEENK